MELLSHDEFGSLRLAQFVPDASAIEELEDWEFAERLWIGEAIGFTEWLRDEEKPDVLGCVSLDLDDLPVDAGQRMLGRFHLPLHKGMNYAEVIRALGEPDETEVFVAGQKSYIFHIETEPKYQLDCTIHETEGLKYLTLMAVGSNGAA